MPFGRSFHRTTAAAQPKPKGAVRIGQQLPSIAGGLTPSGAVASDLLEAVVAKLKADGNVTAQVPATNIYLDQAPVNTTFPFIVVVEIGETAAHSSADATPSYGYIDTGQLQVSIFATGAETCRTIGGLVETSLTDPSLTFTAGYLMNMRRGQRGPTVLDPDPGPGGVDVWHRPLTFQTVIGRFL
jgi:hypothetical protein